MHLKRNLLRASTLSIASLLFLIGSGARAPVYTASLQRTPAEQYVLAQVEAGELAELDAEFATKEERILTADFICDLLTNRDGLFKIHPHGIQIQAAQIKGEIDLINEEVAYDVSLINCTFLDDVDISQSHFAKSLTIQGSIFDHSVDFESATVGFDFVADHCQFNSKSSFFKSMRVGGDLIANDCQFNAQETTLRSLRVGGDFFLRGKVTFSGPVDFTESEVGGNLLAEGVSFKSGADFDSVRIKVDGSLRASVFNGNVSFNEAHLSNLFLNGAHFENTPVMDFTNMQVDSASFDNVTFDDKGILKLQGMSFRLLSPASWDGLQTLASQSAYNAEFYSNLETLFRTHGDPRQADRVFIAKQRRERQENCRDFFRRCNRAGWVWSVFEDAFAGYGRSLENLLYWSAGFLLIGTFVFRSEKGMRTKDKKDAPDYAGKYQAFWYSLDLFLPIIKLGEADVWTPTDDRRWANLYRKVHIIIGSLFVPIGLAAWTGIIK